MSQNIWNKPKGNITIRNNYVEFLEKRRENVKIRSEDFSVGKQVLLCIETAFLVRNVAEFPREAQNICPWDSAACLQTELTELRESLALQEARCSPVTF